MPNNLSGIYFRYRNPETNKWENWCFEDLPIETQEKYMNERTLEWHKNMILALSRTLKNIGDVFEITTNTEDE